MKKIALNISVMLLMSGIGFGTVFAYRAVMDFSNQVPKATGSQITLAKPPVLTTDHGAIAVFVDDQFYVHITNFNSKPAVYLAYTRDMINFSYKRGGKKIPIGYCGTGLEDYVLAPGETLTIRRTEDRLPYQVKEGKGKLQIGVWMTIEGSEGREYWSNQVEVKADAIER